MAKAERLHDVLFVNDLLMYFFIVLVIFFARFPRKVNEPAR